MQTVDTADVRIEAIAACLPANAVRNDEKIVRATGVVTRRLAPTGTTVVDLCVAAAERAMTDVGARPTDFGAVLCVSFTQRDRMPAAAIQAQARLGLPTDVIAFDVSLACSGWGYGLYLAGLLAHETGKKVLLLDGDVQGERACGDEGTEPLLADAGTATVVSPRSPDGEASAPWRFAFAADGTKGEALKLTDGGTIQMDGFGVFKFVATDVVGYVKEFLATSVDSPFASQATFVPHQPNAYMVRQLAKSVGIPEGRTAVSCDELGNLASASVPATIVWKGVRGKVLMAGFGGGLSVSVGAIEVDEACKLSTVAFGE